MVYYEKTQNLTEGLLVLQILKELNKYYPNFHYWFVNTVMPNVVLGNDIMIIAKDDNKIIGVALLKKEGEIKLRCVHVLKEYQNKGIGLKLIQLALIELNNQEPLCSVSEELFHNFSRFFINNCKFKLTSVKKNYYRPGKLEYFFNEKTLLL